MEILATALQVSVALGLLNVWIVRFNRNTRYRGGDSSSMREEFRTYGLSPAVMYVVGALKILAALALAGGIWFPALTAPAALIIAILMIGAIVMHHKVNDPLKKFLPALVMLIMAVSILILKTFLR